MSKRDCGGFSLEEIFRFGNLTVAETRALKNRSHSGFYEDVNRGLSIGAETAPRIGVQEGPLG